MMETIDDIVRELRNEPLAGCGAKPWLDYLADRIEEAAKSAIVTDNTETLHNLLAENARLKAALKPKKYEYSIKNPNGNIMKTHEDEMFPIMPLICKVVRREVGEWEEVPGRE